MFIRVALLLYNNVFSIGIIIHRIIGCLTKSTTFYMSYSESYTCEVNLGTKISWLTETTDADGFKYSLLNRDDEKFEETNNFQVHFTGVRVTTTKFDNYTSTLFVRTLQTVNETNLTCRGEVSARVTGGRWKKKNITTKIRIIGNDCSCLLFIPPPIFSL